MRTRRILTSTAILLISIFCARPLCADGALRGRVVEPNGHPMPGAMIVARGPQGKRTTVTDRRGQYNLYGLVPGRYVLTISVDGYNTQVYAGIPIRSGHTCVENIRLDDEDDDIIYLDCPIDPFSSGSDTYLDHEQLMRFF